MLKAVIFDLDGTMVDTETLYSEAFSILLKTYGVTPKPYKHGLVHMVGVNTQDILKFLMGRYNFSGDIKTLTTKLRENYFQLIQNKKIKPAKGVKKLILLLKKNHLKLAVASGSSSRNINIILKNLSIENFFDAIVGADQVKHGKPHPEIYETTVTKLAISKNDCVVIEDTESGVKAAKSAGLKVVAVPNVFTKDQNFAKADTIVKSLSDITLPLLQNL